MSFLRSSRKARPRMLIHSTHFGRLTLCCLEELDLLYVRVLLRCILSFNLIHFLLVLVCYPQLGTFRNSVDADLYVPKKYSNIFSSFDLHSDVKVSTTKHFRMTDSLRRLSYTRYSLWRPLKLQFLHRLRGVYMPRGLET